MKDIKNTEKTESSEAVVVACQGVEGAYSQIAAKEAFKKPEIIYMRTFEGVFRAVDSGLCRYGVLPIENSDAGTVTEVYDLMKTYNFNVIKDITIPVSHMLLVKEKTSTDNIKEVYTHEQAARQCSDFLKENSHIKTNICANTAVAARYVAESGKDNIAAIASESCAGIYDLKVAEKNVQNRHNNFTRFICISKEK